MSQAIAKSLAAFIFLVATNVYALPIVQADAFSAGDNKAVLDTNTNLTWLDFDINNARSFNQVMSELNSTYLGWRLPTETEVRQLWGSLFNGTLNTIEQYEICNLWGANKSPSDNTPFQAQGKFIDDNGYFSSAGFLEEGKIINKDKSINKYYVDGSVSGDVSLGNRIYDGSSFPSFNYGYEEISTLLVRDNRTVSVPEPSTFILFGIGLFALILRRRYTLK